MDTKSFCDALEKDKERFGKVVIEYQKKVGLSFYQTITTDALIASGPYGSPVYTGRFIASHNVSINSIDTTVSSPHSEADDLRWPIPPSFTLRAKGMAYASRILANLRLFDTIYISNALDYAEELEQGKSRLKAPFPIFLSAAQKMTAQFANVTLR